MDFVAAIEPFTSPLTPFLGDPLGCDYVRFCQSEYEELSRDANISEWVWTNSLLNPRNRLEVLGPCQDEAGHGPGGTRNQWRIDGCAAMGRRLFAVPVYMCPDCPVRRIDVILPCQSMQPPALRRQLRSPDALFVAGRELGNLELGQYVNQALESWSLRLPYFDEIYRNISFGSSIILEEVSPDPRSAKLRFFPNLRLGNELATVSELQAMWKLGSSAWPPALPISALRLVSHLSETVSVVELPKSGLTGYFIFKTNTGAIHRLYHELRGLLTIGPHPNIIRKPHYVITAATDDEPSSSKVLGFVIDYIKGRTLGDALASYPTAPDELKYKWSRQLVTTLKYIMSSPLQFHSDLKPDNILIDESSSEKNLVFIDLEQGGNWDTFCAPEILYVSRMQRLSENKLVPWEKRRAYEELLKVILPHRPSPTKRYSNPPLGYYKEWSNLRPENREAAMVFAVGKLLWCIFEGCSHTTRSLGERDARSISMEFPAFKDTPEELRNLIRRCTLGAPHWRAESVKVVREGSTLSAAVRDVSGEWKTHESPVSILAAYKRLWKHRLGIMESYVQAELRWLSGSCGNEDIEFLGFLNRPSLREVLEGLNSTSK